MEEKLYEKVSDAERIAEELVKKYPDVLWRVKPNKIAFLGITNKERSKKSKDLFKVTPVKGAQKALNQLYKVPVSYIVEMFYADWNEWTLNLREWVILQALLSIHEEDGKTVKMDCKDYRLILDVVGVDWQYRTDLPSLLNEDVKFDLELTPGMDEYQGHEREEQDPIEPDSP